GTLGFALTTANGVEGATHLLDVDLVLLDVLGVAGVLVHALEALDHALDDLLAETHLLQRLNHLGFDVGVLFRELGHTRSRRANLLLVVGRTLLVEHLYSLDQLLQPPIGFFLVELLLVFFGLANDVFDPDLLGAQLVADVRDLLNRDGAIQDRVQSLQFAVFDTLGNLDLAFTREQRDATHLTEIHADRVIATTVRVGRLFDLWRGNGGRPRRWRSVI